jgi:hypothetical protein
MVTLISVIDKPQSLKINNGWVFMYIENRKYTQTLVYKSEISNELLNQISKLPVKIYIKIYN